MSAKPTFLIIAAQKSGTIWLRNNLGKHPQITMGRNAARFFDTNWSKGPEWYFSRFQDDGTLHGEHCPSYTIPKAKNAPPLATVAQRMDETVPDLRLIALLRNPVDRAYSAFIHILSGGRVAADADLLSTVDAQGMVETSRYAEALEPFAQRFGDRLQVLLTDEIRADAGSVYRRALEHVGADPSFRPDDLAEVVHTRQPPEDSPYREGDGRRPLTPEERGAMYERFADDIGRLEELLGRDLGAWRENGAGGAGTVAAAAAAAEGDDDKAKAKAKAERKRRKADKATGTPDAAKADRKARKQEKATAAPDAAQAKAERKARKKAKAAADPETADRVQSKAERTTRKANARDRKARKADLAVKREAALARAAERDAAKADAGSGPEGQAEPKSGNETAGA